jgi:hypothetical protein
MTPREKRLQFVDIVASITHVPRRVIMGRSRDRAAVAARHACIVQFRREGMTSGEIAKIMNMEDSSIRHACRSYERSRDESI